MNHWNQPINIQTFEMGGGLLKRTVGLIGTKVKFNKVGQSKGKQPKGKQPKGKQSKVEAKSEIEQPKVEVEIEQPKVEIEQPKVDQVRKFPNLTGLIEDNGEYFFVNKKGIPKKKAIISSKELKGGGMQYNVDNTHKWYSPIKKKGYGTSFITDEKGDLIYMVDSRNKYIDDKFEKFNFNKRSLTRTGRVGVGLGIIGIPKAISYLYQKSDKTVTPQKSYTPYVDQGKKQEEEKLPDSIYTKPLTNEETLELLMNL